ncbi:RNA polymerase subunit sigma-70 [Rhizobium leguminosarum bv. viciae]|nr:RNA polymerase subunit sigma-70 [Rhizobium leguminosarum bv. viciae]TBZ90228.1 RNA polymerase subunit sigma-70 [Rhizobium leguminosarum bv. viciae]
MEMAKKTPGRPPHIPSVTDRRLVGLLASMGIRQSEICYVLAISEKTLRRHYGAELRRGASKFECALALRLFDLAGGNGAVAVRALQFVLRSRFGWSQFAPPPASRWANKERSR